MNNRKFDKLTRNLEAMLHEGMVKIGYVKGQSVRIYYVQDLLLHLLGLQKGQREQAAELLPKFVAENESLWGSIGYRYENGRYQLTIPPKGMDYVYEKYKNNHFLEDLIAVLREPSVTIEKVLEVFHQYSDEVICEKSQSDEFEYAVRFKDPSIDAFIYCFTFDAMGQYYHRFTGYDYHNLIHETHESE